MWQIILLFLAVGILGFGLAFFVRLLCAPFSPRILKQMERHRALHFLWAGLGLVSLFLLFLFFNPSFWPPVWVERRHQRQEILKRVRSAGGWDALRSDCQKLADKYKDVPEGYRWFRDSPEALPPAIAALKPKQVDFYSRRGVRLFGKNGETDFGTNVVMRIFIFGFHSTGGRGQATLGLDVVCEARISNYDPNLLRSSDRSWRYRKVAKDIYEFY